MRSQASRQRREERIELLRASKEEQVLRAISGLLSLVTAYFFVLTGLVLVILAVFTRPAFQVFEKSLGLVCMITGIRFWTVFISSREEIDEAKKRGPLGKSITPPTP